MSYRIVEQTAKHCFLIGFILMAVGGCVFPGFGGNRETSYFIVPGIGMGLVLISFVIFSLLPKRR